ncbi:hypothetical protein QQS21_002334 [Conoideocrella luteorostrata]|uniref:Cytochrome P450 n=1 Tax=Conoideocrella luteorostrata TaxID=1105319 RepID=A0AAJ0FWN1_9HYPO|nr:hypothetical protein QQS21_002334 [Conoideocrella luteorostrata]
MLLQMLLAIVATYSVWNAICLEINAGKARKMGVPIIRIPIGGNNALWIILQPLVWRFLRLFPFPWSSYPDWLRMSRRDWHFVEKSQPHIRLGPVWALVSPESVNLFIADAEAVHEVYSRRDDFVRPAKNYKLLEAYGPCLTTAARHDYARHRKPLASLVNENMMRFVWGESLRQSGAMMHNWTNDSTHDNGVPSMQKDVARLSLKVLASIGFQKSHGLPGRVDNTSAEGEGGSYLDALQTVLEGIILLLLIPARYLDLPIMPTGWRRIGRASKLFKRHMEQMIAAEKDNMDQGGSGSGGIMTAFVHALEEHETNRNNPQDAKTGKRGLSKDEILGNLFLVNFAGHDTNANTISFALMLLAAYPDVQNWIAEEVESVTNGRSVEQWEYKDLFPRLVRCRAVVLETLRLYPAVVSVSKWTADKAQTLRIGQKSISIPPGIMTSLYVNGAQTHPQYWDNPYDWRPSRWVLQLPSTAQQARPATLQHEELLVPRRGTFFPWSEGVQSCPGKKFAEVEAVAVIAHLFKDHRLSVKREADEGDDSAQKRALDCANDVEMMALLKMANADRVTLVYRTA